jgi:hypothetical protein
MDTVSSSECAEYFYQNIQSHVPKDNIYNEATTLKIVILFEEFRLLGCDAVWICHHQGDKNT